MQREVASAERAICVKNAQRIWRLLIRVAGLALLLVGSWLALMAVHEGGHVLHAWLSGGRVARVEIPLLGFSRTDLAENPHPLFVAWGGALWGCLLPSALLGLVVATGRRWRQIALFFAGLCLIANGAYLAIGQFSGAGDAGDLVRLGTPRWVLVMFGVITAPAGLYCWHRLGPRMGIGQRVPSAARPSMVSAKWVIPDESELRA